MEWSLKRTAKAPVNSVQPVNNDEYYDDDSGSNTNDDYDDEEGDQPTTAAPVPATAAAGAASSAAGAAGGSGAGGNGYQGGQLISHSGNPSTSTMSPTPGNPTFSNNFHPFNYPSLNKDRPILPNPNMTPANQSNKEKMLDFLAGCIGDVTVKKERLPPQ